MAATRDSIGSATLWQAIQDGAAPEMLEALEAGQLARFSPMRDQYLHY
jgi:hypothetical protein